MGLAQKTQNWVSDRIITRQQQEAILDHETNKMGPFFFMGFVWLGILCVLCGTVSLIATYWSIIPDWIKLSSGTVILIGALTASYIFFRKERHLLAEAALFVGFLGIGGIIGLIAQIFRLPLNSGSGIFLWAVLSFFIVVFSRKTYLSFLWIPLFIGGVIGFFNWEFLFLFFQQVPLVTTLVLSLFFLGGSYIFGRSEKVFMKSLYRWSVLLFFGVLILGDYASVSPWSGFFVSVLLLSLMAITAIINRRMKLFNFTLGIMVLRFLILYIQLFKTVTVWAIGGIVFGCVLLFILFFYDTVLKRNEDKKA